MAGLANALAVDGTEMTKPLANAAIYFALDGYDPAAKGINGRRVAGESFLNGYLDHARADEVVSLTHGLRDARHFSAIVARRAGHRRVRSVMLDRAQEIAPLDVLSYPSPAIGRECWRRSEYGSAAYAICGVTHTIATRLFMQSMIEMRTAPQMPWDAVICTSRSALDALTLQMDLIDQNLAARFRGTAPPRPLMPIIPLGINCDDFARDPAAGAALRHRLGIGKDDIACAIVARLSVSEKFDPLPLFIALSRAQAEAGRRFHLMLYGKFGDARSREIFLRGAATLMPGVGFHVIDGSVAEDRLATLSGADIFLFPIDNVQETFGLAPVEAMAAGLPLIVTDWDGMKDTVPPEVGIRVPTEMPPQGVSSRLGRRLYGETDSYPQFCTQLSALTRVDLGALVRALVQLGSDPALRARMGAAGQARARAVYDWATVLPQMQALWGEQAAMVAHARATGQGEPPVPAHQFPPLPLPGLYFRSFPTRVARDPGRRFVALPADDLPAPEALLDLRNYEAANRLIEPRSQITATLAALRQAGPQGATPDDLVAATAIPLASVWRCLFWLMKYGLAE
ncbi:hypothetical protein B6K69_04055 [Fuscovulum blasticum]|nr:hypothetical protein B6K69_04055 [Fuscovulum blasticum]